MLKDPIKRLLSQTPNKILAVGKNYIDHVKEMGGGQFPSSPVIFQKPLTSILAPGEKVLWLPPHGRPIHHEVELVVVIGRAGKDIPQKEANEYIAGYLLGLDLTDRDLQAEFKAKSLPWDLSKGQDGFAPISSFIPRDLVKDNDNMELELKINGETRQKGCTKDMHYKVPFIVEFCSKFMSLNPGDLIYTGTPSGVGAIKDGDKVKASLKENGRVLAEINLDVRGKKGSL